MCCFHVKKDTRERNDFDIHAALILSSRPKPQRRKTGAPEPRGVCAGWGGDARRVEGSRQSFHAASGPPGTRGFRVLGRKAFSPEPLPHAIPSQAQIGRASCRERV